MKGIRLLHEKGKAQPWLVYVNPSIFGKRIRKRFETKAEAQHKVKIYENRVLSKERSPLDPEVHRVVSLFTDRLTASQMMVCLSVGELDTNVDPSSTYQVVNALIKADKDFEFLMVPGAGHGVGESKYAARRRMDFFVRHLLGVEPRAN